MATASLTAFFLGLPFFSSALTSVLTFDLNALAVFDFLSGILSPQNYQRRTGIQRQCRRSREYTSIDT